MVRGILLAFPIGTRNEREKAGVPFTPNRQEDFLDLLLYLHSLRADKLLILVGWRDLGVRLRNHVEDHFDAIFEKIFRYIY